MSIVHTPITVVDMVVVVFVYFVITPTWIIGIEETGGNEKLVELRHRLR